MAEKPVFLYESLQSGEQLFYPTALPIEGEPVIAADSQFKIPGLRAQLEQAKETFFFDDAFYKALQLDDHLMRSAEFRLHEEWAEGRDDSVHQVFFGELTLVVDKGDMSDQDLATTIPVAMKPHLSGYALGIHEYAAYRNLQKEAFIPTLDTLGFWVDNRGMVFMMTYFEEDVRSLDNVDWADTGLVRNGEDFSVVDALQRSAFILGKLHGRGYAHGDAQVKNMAVGNRGVKVVDPELTRKLQMTDDALEDPHALAVAIGRDMNRLVESVVTLGRLSTKSHGDTKAVIKGALLEPHASLLRHPSTPLRSDELNEEIDQMSRDILQKI